MSTSSWGALVGAEQFLLPGHRERSRLDIFKWLVEQGESAPKVQIFSLILTLRLLTLGTWQRKWAFLCFFPSF
jgi:hypothetical protein